MCFLFYAPSDNEIKGECGNNDMITELYFSNFIMTHENMYEIKEEDQGIQSQIQIAKLNLRLTYWCLPNNCNSRSMAELIRKTVKDHYNMSGIYEALNVKIEDNSEENSTISNEINTIPSVPSLTSKKETSMTTISSTKTTATAAIITITSTITTTKQPNNTATSLHISIIITIFNAVLFFLN